MVEETLKSLSEKAEAASNAGKLQEAIRLYDEMLTFALQHKVGDRTVAEIQRDRAKALTTRGKPHEAIEAAKEARSLFRALEDKRGMASANNTIGLNYDHLGEYSLAAFHYLDSLQVLRELKFEPGIAQVLSNLGLTLAYIGAYEEALEYLQEGLEMWRKGPTSLGLAMAYANIAFVMCETHRAKESELYHQKALEIYIKENAIAHQSNAYCNLAVLAQETGDMQKMDQLTAKALEIAEQSGSKLRVAIALNSRGNFYTHSGDRQQARNVLLQALALFKEIDVPRGVALALKDLSSCAEDAGQALAHLREGLKIAEHANLIPVQLAILELLHSQQVKQDLWREAHSTYQTLSALKTRLLNDRAEFKIRSIHLELELSQSRMETALQRERSDALQSALDEAEKQRNIAQEENRQKTQLLHFAAHDLRNMISGMVGTSEYVVHELNGLPTFPELREMAGLTAQSARQMLQSLNCILDAAAIERGNIQLHPTRFKSHSMIKEAIAFWHFTAHSKNQQLVIGSDSDDIELFADRIRLMDCLGNLISNAIKYAELNTRIEVGSSVRDGHWCLYVKDEGPGISDKDLQKLGNAFQRLSANPTGGESSIGIGLFIVTRIMELHGGRLEVFSEKGKGSCFELLLPEETSLNAS